MGKIWKKKGGGGGAFLFITLRSHFNEGKGHNAILVLLKL